MQVYTKIVLNLLTDSVIECRGYEYTGPLAECISFGGSKSKSKSKQKSESGTKFDQYFLDQAINWGAGKDPQTGAERWDPSYKKELMPEYNPGYVRVAPEGFQKLEDTAYESSRSKLQRAYDTSVARQREELAQMGALNSPSQFLEGSARSSLDRSYMDSLQQAARDAFTQRLGLEEREAARETGFNERTAANILDLWLKKIGLAIESGRYATGEGSSSGGGSGFNFGLFNFGGSQTSNASTS